jgi:hypothetical protein
VKAPFMLTLAVCGLAVCGACAAGAVEFAMPTKALLSASAPQREFDAPRLPFAPGTVALVVDRIENPRSQGFSIACAVRADDAGGLIEIGAATPYPPDQGGTFVLAVNDVAAALLARKDGAVRVRLSLAPLGADRPLTEPLQVAVSTLTWHARGAAPKR